MKLGIVYCQPSEVQTRSNFRIQSETLVKIKKLSIFTAQKDEDRHKNTHASLYN